MTITSLTFSFVQYSSTAAMANAKAPASAPAPQPVAQDSCHGGGCDSPRRSPLFRALNDALLEMTRATQPAAAASCASSPSTSGAAAASTAAATSTTSAATSPTTGTAPSDPAAEAAAAPDLEHALMDFARALMQALRSGFQQGRGDDGEHEGRRHHHHHHHQGQRGWGDPAQRVDGLAQRVSGASASDPPVPDTPVAPAPTTRSTVAVGDDTPAPAVAGSAPAAAGSQDAVLVVASIGIGQTAAAAPASPFDMLSSAFAGLQQAMGKSVASGDSLRNDLSAFLQSLAQRLRGEDPATAEAATRPGALLSVAA